MDQIPKISGLAIFASGQGSNAARIIAHFGVQAAPVARPRLVVSNKPEAPVLDLALGAGVPTLVIGKEEFFHGDAYLPQLKAAGIEFIVLAGFLWKVPPALIWAFPGRIINIHPSLLPKYGGKGMYGRHVHEAVLAAGDPESGITIHEVDELYDHGATLFQATCPVLPTDDPDSLARRIHTLEHEHFPVQIEAWLKSKKSLNRSTTDVY